MARRQSECKGQSLWVQSFLFQLFAQAQGFFKTKHDFHCQGKLFLSYCSLLFAGGCGRWGGRVQTLSTTCSVDGFKKRGWERSDQDPLRDPAVERPGCVALAT